MELEVVSVICIDEFVLILDFLVQQSKVSSKTSFMMYSYTLVKIRFDDVNSCMLVFGISLNVVLPMFLYFCSVYHLCKTGKKIKELTLYTRGISMGLDDLSLNSEPYLFMLQFRLKA